MSKHHPYYCADTRAGIRVHVNASGHTVHGPSRLVHKGGRIACDDGVVPQAPTGVDPRPASDEPCEDCQHEHDDLCDLGPCHPGCVRCEQDAARERLLEEARLERLTRDEDGPSHHDALIAEFGGRTSGPVR